MFCALKVQIMRKYSKLGLKGHDIAHGVEKRILVAFSRPKSMILNSLFIICCFECKITDMK